MPKGNKREGENGDQPVTPYLAEGGIIWLARERRGQEPEVSIRHGRPENDPSAAPRKHTPRGGSRNE